MKNTFLSKLAVVIIIVTFIFTSISKVEAVEIGVRIPFGPGSDPKKNDIIEKLKNEETDGVFTGLGLVILGACIIAATVLIINEIDDTTDNASDIIDEIKEEID